MDLFVKSTQSKFRTKNHLMLIGGDFYYANMTEMKWVVDLFKEIGRRAKGFDIQFATPSEYFEAVYKEKKRFKEFQGDLLPLISPGYPVKKPWTGFYSTLPSIKQGIFELQSLVRAHEIISASLKSKPVIAQELASLAHHDAITATCRLPVFNDYIFKLDGEKLKLLTELAKNFNKALKLTQSSSEITLPYKVLYLFNPLGWEVTRVLSVKGQSSYIRVQKGNGEYLVVQAVKWSEDEKEFFFQYTLPAYTLEVVFVNEYPKSCFKCSEDSKVSYKNVLDNDFIQISFNLGMIHQVTYEDKSYTLDCKFMNYSTIMSGPYTFNPYVKNK